MGTLTEEKDCAWDEIHRRLNSDEELVAVVFGRDEWSENDLPELNWEGYIPDKLRYVVLSPETAKPFMLDWKIDGSYGSAQVIPMYVWTNERVLFIATYDGATWLESVPRNPTDIDPTTMGGG